jgi:two-component system, NtrC family, response regulator
MEVVVVERDTLLIIEDDLALQKQLQWHFSDKPFEVVVASNYDSAIAAFRLHEPAVVIQDLGLPPDEDGVKEGFRSIEELLRLGRHTKVIVMTGSQDTSHALKAIGMGAWDFFTKPVDTDVLNMMVTRAFQIHSLEKHNVALQQSQTASFEGLVTQHSKMLKICRQLEKVAPTDLTCTLLGESGTGKDVLARAIHQISPRNTQAFVAINCAAIPESLIESELFGHEKGSFTGAHGKSIGKFETAHRGTLFLDEVGDLPLPAQAKLLRFIQERVVQRVGSHQEIPIDVRIICATNKSLKDMVDAGTFREDLYFRISELVIDIPPLRDRGEDKLLLANHFLRQYAEQYDRPVMEFSESAIAAIDSYTWPGNIRELISKVKSAVIFSDTRQIDGSDLEIVEQEALPLNLNEVRQAADRAAINKVLTITTGRPTKAAQLLGVTRPTLYNMMKKCNITSRDFKSKKPNRKSSERDEEAALA